jgi:hypothetical protein
MAFSTAKSFHGIKNTTKLTTALKKHNAFIAKHKFTITKSDILSLGWFCNLHPSLMSHNPIKEYLAAEVKMHCPSKTNILFYQLLNMSPWHKETGMPDMRTNAIQISCTHQNSQILHKSLTTALAHNPIYIPWQTRRNNVTNYKNNICAQHKYLINTWTIHVPISMNHAHNYTSPVISLGLIPLFLQSSILTIHCFLVPRLHWFHFRPQCPLLHFPPILPFPSTQFSIMLPPVFSNSTLSANAPRSPVHLSP